MSETITLVAADAEAKVADVIVKQKTTRGSRHRRWNDVRLDVDGDDIHFFNPHPAEPDSELRERIQKRMAQEFAERLVENTFGPGS